MLKLNSIMVGTTNIEELVRFYEQVIGRPAEMEEEGWHGWMVGNTFFSVGVHSEMKGEAREPGRVMFNFETEQVKEECERISGLGALVIKEPYELEGMWIATLADPDGNYFQLMSPWKG